jgi:hypothetical protein
LLDVVGYCFIIEKCVDVLGSKPATFNQHVPKVLSVLSAPIESLVMPIVTGNADDYRAPRSQIEQSLVR